MRIVSGSCNVIHWHWRRSNPDALQLIEHHVQFVLALDRYCWQTMLTVIWEAESANGNSTPGASNVVAKFSSASLDKQLPSKGFQILVYRHKSKEEGRFHIAHSVGRSTIYCDFVS